MAWYIDAPKALAAQPPVPPRTSAAACRDEVKANVTGEASLLGFPIAYTTTAPGPDGKPVIVMQMEMTEFEVTNLDASLFEIPAGMTAVANGRELAKAISDANEAKLAARTPTSGAPPARKAGVIRVGVPELANKTTQNVDTRALRTQLIAELAEQKMEGGAARRGCAGRAACLCERARLRLPAGGKHYRAEGVEAGTHRTHDQSRRPAKRPTEM